MYPQEQFGLLAFMVWQVHRAETAAQKRSPQPSGDKIVLRQFKGYVGRVLVDTGLKLQRYGQLSAG